ncbi:TIGR00266 family protein [Enterococcus hailinensis]|uniref:TIGR00266 family protein n=1 Tax=Enterococcus hailinensis TaxID=3238988 RepID=UPI0038B311A4
MNYEISDSTFAPIAKITLSTNEKLRIERGAMVYTTGNIELEGTMNSNSKKGFGGALSAVGRSVTSGESVFISTATSHSDNSVIAIAPSDPGKIFALDVGNEHWRLNTGAFLASEENVNYQMKRQKLSGALLGGTGGLFVMETTGNGKILVSAFGDIEKIELDGTKTVTINNRHVIAWSNSLDYSIHVASGKIGFKTGAGIVTEFSGQGCIYIQTRNLRSFARHISDFIPNTNS